MNMTWQIMLTLSVLAMVIAGMTLLQVVPEVVLWGGLTVLLVAGVLDSDAALSGFSNEGLIAVAVLYVVAEALSLTGSMSFIGQRLLGEPRGIRSAQTRTMLPAAALSAFMNNTPVVALMLPILSDWARKHRISVSHLFLPLSYAAILGGLCTLVGTSTTLVVSKELPADKQLGMFEIAWVGVPVLVAGLGFLLLFSQRLLKERRPAFTPLDDPREYTVEMKVAAESPLVGQTIEKAGLRHLPGMYLMEIDRRGEILAAVGPETRLEADDQLIFVGVVDSVVDLRKIPGLKPATDQLFKLDSPTHDRCLVEAVVSNSYPNLRTTIRESGFRSKYNAAVIAVARDGARLREKIGDIELLPGDTLLLECHQRFLEEQRNSRDFFLVSRVEGSTPVNHERASIAQFVMVAMITVVTLRKLSMLQASLVAVGLLTLTRCIRPGQIRRAIDLGVVLVMAGGLGLGRAMEASGTDEFIAGTLRSMTGSQPLFMLTIIVALTMILANLITTQAAALLVLPIAMATAAKLGVNEVPFVISVIIAAASSFVTPIGYQTNLMVYGPGGYRSSDYLRVGVPLSMIVAIVTIIVAPVAWPF